MAKRTQICLLLLIIAGGAVLRMVGFSWGQGYQTSAIGDEIEAYRVALRFQAGDDWKAFYLGQPNFKKGKVPGPLWTLVWAVPLYCGGGPEQVILLIVAMNIVAIWLTYLLGQKLFDGAVGLWAALFIATAPWPVYNSIGCTNPEVMALLGALLYLALWDVLTQPRSRKIFWVVVVLAAMPQFHMIGVFLILPIVLLLSWRRRQINGLWLALGLVFAGVLYAPYLFSEVSNHWENTRRFFENDEKFSLGSFKALTTTAMSLTNVFESAAGQHFADYMKFGDAAFGSFYVLAAINLFSIGMAVFVIGNFVCSCKQAMRGRWLTPSQAFAATPAVVFIGMMVVLPLLLFIPTGASFNSRYVIVAYPLLFLLPALVAVKFLRRRLVQGAVIATIAMNIWVGMSFFHYQGHLIADANYFVPSFRKMESVRQQLAEHAEPNRRFSILAVNGFPTNRDHLLTHGANTFMNYIRLCCAFANTKPATSRFYLIYPDYSSFDKRIRIVYRGNGIAVVEWKPDRLPLN